MLFIWKNRSPKFAVTGFREIWLFSSSLLLGKALGKLRFSCFVVTRKLERVTETNPNAQKPEDKKKKKKVTFLATTELPSM